MNECGIIKMLEMHEGLKAMDMGKNFLISPVKSLVFLTVFAFVVRIFRNINLTFFLLCNIIVLWLLSIFFVGK